MRQIGAGVRYSSGMRRLLPGAALLALVVLLVLIGTWWFSPGPNAVATDRASDRAAATAPARPRGGPASGPGDDDDSARARRLREGTIAREAMRKRILEAAAAREASAPTGQPGPAVADAPSTTRPARPKPAVADAPEELPALNDRTGNHAYITRVFSEQLMPLVQECDELARASNPKLSGMLNLNLDLVGDEDIGGVIDTIEPDPSNEVTDPTMMECVRESLLAITLPPPDDGGRDGMMLSLRLDPED